jgi:hypothetical protein
MGTQDERPLPMYKLVLFPTCLDGPGLSITLMGTSWQSLRSHYEGRIQELPSKQCAYVLSIDSLRIGLRH